MSDLIQFQYEGRQVRTVTLNNDHWFVLRDVCEILDLTTPARVSERLDPDEVSLTHITDSLGRQQETTIINESGLYNVILRSDKPEARAFRKWITSDVLPTIRRHGMYATPSTIEAMLDDPDLAIRLFSQIKAERIEKEQLKLESAMKDQIIHELQPKATYYDLILQNTTGMAITNIAKDYGMSAMRMNQILHEQHVQFKQGETWFLYQDHADKDFTSSKTVHYINSEGVQKTKLQTNWTQKGRIFIYHLLKDKLGIVPLVERECRGA
jgi:prophage antirepressor-like protein